MIYVRSAPPDALPISIETFRAHTRREADDASEDLLLASYLEAAAAHLDGRDGLLGRCLVAQEWSAYADAPIPIPGAGLGFRLELGPIRADTLVTVRYRRGADWLVVDAGDVRVEQERFEEASVVLAPGRSWPAPDPGRRGWRIDFTAGFGAPEHVPEAIRAAILLLAADLDGDRSGKTLSGLALNPTVDRLLAPYRKVAL